jgi:hypothetical protein
MHKVSGVSSVSAMMFMEDFERAALLAQQNGIVAGLQLNFTDAFSARQRQYSLMDRNAYRTFPNHHTHLCENVLRENRLLPGIIVRRSLSFRAGKKAFINCAYRYMQNIRLVRRYRLADLFYDPRPLNQCERL